MKSSTSAMDIPICLLVLLITLSISNSFHSLHMAKHNSIVKSQLPLNAASSSTTISSRRALFFNIVEAGLRDRYKDDDIWKILKFCQYASKEVSLPLFEDKYHDPCEEYIDGLTAKPWWNKNDFAWSKDLEKVSDVIVKELDQFEAEHIFKSDSRYQQTMGTGWTAFRLQRFGEWIEANCELFPQTIKLLKSLSIPLAMRGVMFAKQKPFSGVQPHSDGRNFILTGHLGLKIPIKNPEKCWIKVGEEKVSWKANELIIFDTSFTHETMNDTDEDRYVLIIDFWHPELSVIEQESLQYIYDCRNKFDNNKMYDIQSSYITQMKEEEERKSKGIFGVWNNLFKS